MGHSGKRSSPESLSDSAKLNVGCVKPAAYSYEEFSMSVTVGETGSCDRAL